MVSENIDFEKEARKLLSRQKELHDEAVRILEARGYKSINQLIEEASEKGEKYSQGDRGSLSDEKSVYQSSGKSKDSARRTIPEKARKVQEKASKRARKKRKKIDEINTFEGYNPDY